MSRVGPSCRYHPWRRITFPCAGRALRRRRGRLAIAVGLAVLIASGLRPAADGGRQRRGQPLSWYVFNEPCGAFNDASPSCNEEAGRPLQDRARQAADRRRPAARAARPPPRREGLGHRPDRRWTSSGPPSSPRPAGSSEWTGRTPTDATKGTLAGPLKTAHVQGQALGGARSPPTRSCSGTARTVSRTPPKTWDELIDQAESSAPRRASIEVQGARYEGLTVWFNSLVASAGGQIVDENGKRLARRSPPSRRVEVMRSSRDSPTRRPGAVQHEGGPDAPRVPVRQRGLHGQLPVHLPEREGGGAGRPQEHGLRALPGGRRRAARASVTLGGINLGVSALHRATPSWRSRPPSACASSENQLIAAPKGGLPPTTEALYDDPRTLQKAYPVRRS